MRGGLDDAFDLLPVPAALGGALLGEVDLEAGLLQDRPRPQRPTAVLRHEADVHVGDAGRPVPGVALQGASAQGLLDPGHPAHLAVGEDLGESLVGGEQALGVAGCLAEGGEGLLVGVDGAVGDLHPAPVVVGFGAGGEVAAQDAVEAVLELAAGRLQPVGLGVLHAHGDGQDADAAVAVHLLDAFGDGDRAVDALAARRETGDEGVRQVDGADVGDVVEARAAVDEDVVVPVAELALEAFQEAGGERAVHERLPVELREGGQIALVLGAGREVVEPAAVGEVPGDRQHATVEGEHLAVPGGVGHGDGLDRVVAGSVRGGGVPHLDQGLAEAGDEFEHAGRDAQFLLVQEGVEEAVEPGGVEIPVDGEHAVSGGGQDPGGVGECHRPSRTALVRVERDDPALVAGHGLPSVRSPVPLLPVDKCE